MHLSRTLRYLMGQVIQRSPTKPGVVKVRAKKMKMDEYLLMYFPKKQDMWCLEKEHECRIGDVVVVKSASGDLPHLVTHQIDQMVFGLGNVVDPVSGRRCRGTEYIDLEEREAEKSKMGNLDNLTEVQEAS